MKSLLKRLWQAFVALAVTLAIIFGAYGHEMVRPPTPSSSRIRRDVNL